MAFMDSVSLEILPGILVRDAKWDVATAQANTQAATQPLSITFGLNNTAAFFFVDYY